MGNALRNALMCVASEGFPVNSKQDFCAEVCTVMDKSSFGCILLWLYGTIQYKSGVRIQQQL